MKLLDYYTPDSGGIFAAISGIYDAPWVGTWDAQTLDTTYYYMVSGDKTPSAFVDRITKNSVGVDVWSIAAKIIVARYGTKWGKLWDTLTAQYNPIHNYDMTETSTDTTNNSGDDVQQTRQRSGGQGNIYAFNSRSPVPSTYTGGTGVGETVTQHGHNISVAHNLTRSGNIGVMTTQQMLQSERDLWMWDYIAIVFADVDSVLACAVYD